MEHKPILFSCTHRAQGNSNKAVDLFLKGIRLAGGDADVIYLRKMRFMPCTACRLCEKGKKPSQYPSKCPLSPKDFAHETLEKLVHAPFAFFASPIYFYHLPSIFKTLIDRSQEYWVMWQKGEEPVASLPERPAYTCLVAGRDKGDKLFEGALLTMKYFLRSFNMTLDNTLTYRGVERIGDLEKEEARAQEIVEMGKAAWLRAVEANPALKNSVQPELVMDEGAGN